METVTATCLLPGWLPAGALLLAPPLPGRVAGSSPLAGLRNLALASGWLRSHVDFGFAPLARGSKAVGRMGPG